MDAAEKNGLVEINFSLSVLEPASGKLKKVLAARYTLAKCDVNLADEGADDWIRIDIEPGQKPMYADAKVSVNSHHKLPVTALKDQIAIGLRKRNN